MSQAQQITYDDTDAVSNMDPKEHILTIEVKRDFEEHSKKLDGAKRLYEMLYKRMEEIQVKIDDHYQKMEATNLKVIEEGYEKKLNKNALATKIASDKNSRTNNPQITKRLITLSKERESIMKEIGDRFSLPTLQEEQRKLYAEKEKFNNFAQMQMKKVESFRDEMKEFLTSIPPEILKTLLY